MRLGWVLIPLVLIGIVGVQSAFADESLYYVASVESDGVNLLRGISAIDASGDYVYAVAYQDNRIVIVDVSNPHLPTVVSSFYDTDDTTLNIANGIDVVGNFVYVTSGFNENGISILDVSDPANPIHVGTLSDDDSTLLSGAAGIEVHGNFVYVASGSDSAVSILDVSNPSNIVQLGSIIDDGAMALNHPRDITVVDGYAYVASIFDHGLAILDVSDPANPIHVGSVFDDDATSLVQSDTVTVIDGYAYVGSIFDHAVTVIDVSNPVNPKPVGTINDDDSTSLKGTTDIIVNGNYAYVGAYLDGGIEILDVSNPFSPVHVDSITKFDKESLFGAGTMAMVGEYLYVGTANGFDILTTNPSLTSDSSSVNSSLSSVDTAPVIASDSPFPVTVSNLEITDFFNNPLNEVISGQQVLIQVDLTNNLDVAQEFVYNLTFEDKYGTTNTHPHWIEGNLPASFTFPAGVAVDFPFSGEYTVTIEIWNNRSDKTLIAPTVSHSIVVEGDIPSSIIQKSVDVIDDNLITEKAKPSVSDILVTYDQTWEYTDGILSPSYMQLYNNLVYVIDNQKINMQVYDFDGNFIFDFLIGTPENPDPAPISFAIDSLGKIYIADAHTPLISVFSDDGTYLFSFQRDNHKPDDHDLIDGYHGNTGIFVNNDKIYVSDALHNNIHIFSNDGEYLSSLTNDSLIQDSGLSSFFSFNSDGTVELGSDNEKIISPMSISVIDDKIYVASQFNREVQVFSEDGKFLSSFAIDFDPESLALPTMIATDNNNQVYVLYSTQTITVFSEDGEFLFDFGTTGTDDGEFGYVTGIQVNDSGDIFVSDTLNKQIYVFDSDGNHISSFGEQLTNQVFYDPVNVEVGIDGKIYVSDFRDDEIRVYSNDQEFLYNIGGDVLGDSVSVNHMNNVNAVIVDGDKVYVADPRDDTVYVFSDTGTHLFSFGATGTEKGEFSGPRDISLDSDGNIYVADMRNHRLQIFSSDGESLSTIGSRGYDEHGFFNPSVLEVDDVGRLYVADNSNDRVRILTNDGIQISEFGRFGINDDEFSDRPLSITSYYNNDSPFTSTSPDNREPRTMTSPRLPVPLIFGGEKGDTHLDIDPRSITISKDGTTFTIMDRSGEKTVFVNENNDSISFETAFPLEPSGFDTISDIEVDDKGRIYVTDMSDDEVRVFSPEGLLLSVLGGEGSGDDNFYVPTDVAVYDDTLYVADRSNHRIQIFKITEVSNTGNTISSKEKIIDAPVDVKVKPIPKFVDQSKDPQHYIDRYNNEELYREWFDTNYSEYDSIYQAVGLDEPSDVPEIPMSDDSSQSPLLRVNDEISKSPVESSIDSALGMEHVFTFGEEGTKDGQFNHPSDIVIDKNNQVYVLDRGDNKISVFSDNGNHLFSFGESIEHQFGYLADIAVDDEGRIYVCDDGHHKIHVFSNNGEYLFDFGSEGDGEGELNRPQGLAVGPDSRVYVTESENNRVQVFSNAGDFIFSFGEKGSDDGQFFNPQGIDIDSNGNIYVVDRGNIRTQVFSNDGEHLVTFDAEGEFGLIYDVDVDSENNIYVSNEAHDQIQVYSSDGTFLFSFGSYDTGAANRFQSPMGLAINDDDMIYAVDAGKKNIKVFGKSTKIQTNLMTEQVLYIGLDDAKMKELWEHSLESHLTGNNDRLLDFSTREIPLSSALEVSVDTEGKIFVADNRDNLIKVFSDEGEYLYGFGGGSGIGTGELSMLIGMDMGSKNNLYVANTGQDIIQVFSNDGEFLYDFETPGTGDEFDTPIDVAVGKDGRIYVVDAGHSEIQVFSNDGTYLFDIDSSNMYRFGNLQGVDVADDGKIYAISNTVVMVFSNEGDFLYFFGNSNPNPNTDEFRQSLANSDVTVDKDGRIYVSERNNAEINIFSNDGVYLHTIDGTTSDGKFNMLLDVEVDNNGRIYVADHGKTRIDVFLLHDDINDNENSPNSIVSDVADSKKIVDQDMSEDPTFFENIFGFFKSLFN